MVDGSFLRYQHLTPAEKKDFGLQFIKRSAQLKQRVAEVGECFLSACVGLLLLMLSLLRLPALKSAT